MKKGLIISAMLAVSMSAFPRDVKTLLLTTEPQMRCESCETKVQGALSSMKGVEEVTTSLKTQVITVVYDADKTSETTLMNALKSNNFTPRKLKAGEKVKVNVKTGECANECDKNGKNE